MEIEMLVRTAILLQLAGLTNTPTFEKVSVPMTKFLMDPANHAKYLKLQKEVEIEYRAATGKAGNVVPLGAVM